MTQKKKLTEAQADALRWTAQPSNIATPRRDVLQRLAGMGLITREVKAARSGNQDRWSFDATCQLTEAGKLALLEADAIREAPFRIRTGAR